jgi:hypothetical protein
MLALSDTKCEEKEYNQHYHKEPNIKIRNNDQCLSF